MAGLFDYDSDAARSQSLFAALLASAPQLMAAGAPSTQPGSWGRGIGAAGPAFIQAQQGYLGNQQNMAFRAMQMKKMQEELTQQDMWRKMWGGAQTGQTQSGLFDTQGGEMLSEPKPQSLFGVPPEAQPLVGAMGPEKGALAALKFGFPQMDPTAPMQNFAHRTQLIKKFGETSPEVNRFDSYVRSNPWLNLGGEMVLPNPSQPGIVAGVLPKSVPPEQQPGLKGAQAEAKGLGELEVEKVKMRPKAEGALRSLEMQASIVDKKVDEAINQAGALSAGYGSVLGVIPGTDARNLERTLDTIKSNIGFDKLQEMRANSPTGGALGSIAVQELVALQSTLSSITPDQEPGQLKKNLLEVKRLYKKIVEDRRQAFDQDYGGVKGPTGGRKPAAAEYDYIPGKGLVPR